jgi:hypothetical protein
LKLLIEWAPYKHRNVQALQISIFERMTDKRTTTSLSNGLIGFHIALFAYE